jgi:hypothetical protein
MFMGARLGCRMCTGTASAPATGSALIHAVGLYMELLQALQICYHVGALALDGVLL